MRQADGGDLGRVFRFVVLQPAQLGQRDGGDREGAGALRPVGGTGFGVRTLLRWLEAGAPVDLPEPVVRD